MAKDMMNFDVLLEHYRSIWNNRLLAEEGKGSQEVLTEAIKRELLDENSHPRIRKGMYEKYFSAINRILKSSIAPEAKLLLIELHNHLMERTLRE